jgi:glycine amidinotransferase
MRLNSCDEWSPLQEVVLGSAANYISHERELSFELFFQDNIARYSYPRLSSRSASTGTERRAPIKQRYLEELIEDLDGMAKTLESLSVRVLRPIDLAADTADIRTLAWSAAVVPPLNVRDISLVVGDEVIETAPMIRSRYFETQFLKPIFAEYFRQGSRWTVMPRPIMTDASFDLSYAMTMLAGPTEPIREPQPSPYDVGHEMLFDGAQCQRLGRDILVNVSTENHALGFEWLRRHLDGRFRLHRIDKLSDSHIDSMLLPLRPGTFLVRHEGVAVYLPEPLRKLEMIIPPPPKQNHFPVYEADDLMLTSTFIDLNVLSVGPDTVMVNEACPELMSTLEKHGFTVVPVRHRHRRIFGGGFHCFTLDTVRSGGPEDYIG